MATLLSLGPCRIEVPNPPPPRCLRHFRAPEAVSPKRKKNHQKYHNFATRTIQKPILDALESSQCNRNDPRNRDTRVAVQNKNSPRNDTMHAAGHCTARHQTNLNNRPRNLETGQGSYFHAGHPPFTNAHRTDVHSTCSDSECLPSFPKRTRLPPESSGQQRYDHFSAEHYC